jgi:hypothetical protein
MTARERNGIGEDPLRSVAIVRIILDPFTTAKHTDTSEACPNIKVVLILAGKLTSFATRTGCTVDIKTQLRHF